MGYQLDVVKWLHFFPVILLPKFLIVLINNLIVAETPKFGHFFHSSRADAGDASSIVHFESAVGFGLEFARFPVPESTACAEAARFVP